MKKSKGEMIFDVLNYSFMFMFALICVIPFYYIIVISFNEGKDAIRGGVYLYPRAFTLDNYIKIFQDKRVLNSFFISVFRTVLGTAIPIISNSMYAYALSKRALKYNKFFNWMILIPMYFGGGIIPYYLVCKGVGLTNNIWVYVIPYIITPFYVLLLRVGVEAIPISLEESARIDGASYLKIYSRIILPFLLPSIATITLLSGIGHWNEWLEGTIMMSNSTKWPLQTLLLNILQGSDLTSLLKSRGGNVVGLYKKMEVTTESIKMAMLVITITPILIVYPFFQKYFIKGMIVGAVKE